MVPRDFLLGFSVGLLNSFWNSVLKTSWSGRQAGEFCCPKFFAAAKQPSRYVGKLNSVEWLVFEIWVSAV